MQSLLASRLTRAAVLLCACAPAAAHAAIMGVVWPINATPVVTRSFGSLENGAIHGGLDIPAARGTAVRAAFTGKITKIDTDGTNPDASDITVVDAAGREWYYGHIEPLNRGAANELKYKVFDGTATPAGTIDTITVNTDFAQVRRAGTDRSGSYGHIHFEESANPGDNGKTSKDPLRYVFPANTVSESINARSMTFRPRDGKFTIYGQTTITRVPKQFIRGHVDVLGEITDDMGGTKFAGTESDLTHEGTTIDLFKGYSGTPAKVSYEIDKPAYVDFGTLATRTQENFKDDQQTHNGRASTTYDDPKRSIASGNAGAAAGERGGNKDNYTYILSQTDGTIPKNTNYWNTAADRANASPDGTGADTNRNASAKFQDGVATVGSTGYTVNGLIGGTSLVSSKSNFQVLLNNYKQTADTRHAAGQLPADPTGLSDETQGLEEAAFSQDPLIDVFNLNEHVFSAGAQYVGGHTYTAYVEPWQAKWTEGDSLAASAIATATLTSEANGDILSQFLWTASALGDYNVIIDYDNNAQYSWTLDGLNSFTVIPEPSSLPLLLLPIPLLSRRRR